jgi:hypothetical protein
MLFDLRSRGRRRSVQVIYAGLAVLMFGGLVLFGVGAGGGGGGLLNAFTGGGSSGAQNQVVSQALRNAEKRARDNPSSESAWAQLIQAQYVEASQGNNIDSATGTYTSAGKQLLADATRSWQHYLTLAKRPDPGIAILAARAHAQLAQYAGAANAWEMYTLAEPSTVKGFVCLAAASYAAGEKRKGGLAAARALSLVSRQQPVEKLTVKQTLDAAKTSPLVAQQC